MPRILFLTLHRRDRSPGQRYRHEQYILALEGAGCQCTSSPLLSKWDDGKFYKPGNFIFKLFIGLKALTRRMFDIPRAYRYDYIFIYRDAFFFGTFIERMLRWSGAKLIFDFDDSIWLMDENPNQGIFNKLKNPAKTGKIISLCHHIIAGNGYLANYARKHNPNVTIIPSTIDLSEYQVPERQQTETVCVGWTGSFSTIKHFKTVVPALRRLKEKYGDSIRFKVIGDASYAEPSLDIQGVKWLRETEVSDLSEIQIGLMPLPDDLWSKGKCAMKGLQYMALGIPVVLSPVGVNSEIIQDGENGFLASTEDEWVTKISLLIEDVKLREKIGASGRATVESDFSTEANREKWLNVFLVK
jgi:glycosyltransferase involved in cell wall biosynthesis